MRIEDYALIGDCHTAALVSRAGSIDWLCWPRFDSAACFAALLGEPKHGRWSICPSSKVISSRRAYQGHSLILETDFETAEGSVTLIDFMPIRTRQCDIVRLVVGRRGRVKMDMQLVQRFDYGYSVPWVTKLEDGQGIRAVAGPDMAVLRAPVEVEGKDFTTVASFDVGEGDRVPFVLTYQSSHAELQPPTDAERALADTAAFWDRWCGECRVEGKWRDAVIRSLVTLKALTYHPTGGIVAAPTTSLPERMGGVRNWDYRYCWLRDATLTLLAMMDAGYRKEAARWREWLVRAVAGSPSQMQIMYGVAGERRLPEWEVPWLPGFEGSSPVRIGNAASAQLQIDVYGELLDALYQACKHGIARYAPAWDVQLALLEHLSRVWTEPDAGMWEVRGPPRHFTHSKIMAWVAVDRAVKEVEQFGYPGPVDEWRKLRDAIHADVCKNGYNAKRGCFVQSYGSAELDASLLLIPITGFLPCSDPRVAATVRAIEKELTADGFVLRYRTHKEVDGLPPGEGVFLACSFWLADVMLMMGRRDDAERLFERLVGVCNDVGLLSEEYDPASKRFLGNFPQAFSHVALVNTAMNLSHAEKPVEQRAEEKAA